MGRIGKVDQPHPIRFHDKRDRTCAGDRLRQPDRRRRPGGGRIRRGGDIDDAQACAAVGDIGKITGNRDAAI